MWRNLKYWRSLKNSWVNKKSDKEVSKDKTGNSRKKIHSEIVQDKFQIKREEDKKRNDSNHEDDCYNCPICYVKVGSFWTHNTKDYRILN